MSETESGANKSRLQISPLEATAVEALQNYARNPVVFLLDGPIGPECQSATVGSGTLVRTPCGRIAVLTAKHNFDVPPGVISIGGNIAKGISDAIDAVISHPDDSVDVALAILKANAAASLGDLAVPATCIASSTDVRFEQENPMILCGYPIAYRRTLISYSAKVARVEFACASYVAQVSPELDDMGRYHATWKEAILTERDSVYPPIKRGEEFTMAHPGGISGGPLWRFRKPDKDEVWMPAKMGSIVGIACTYRSDLGIEYCPSTRVWGNWYCEAISAVNAAIGM